jgi:hypothetical protein
MHNFLLDLWHDLREKRLWPIAAVLLAATAAVPFVLLEKEQPAAPPAPTAMQGQTDDDKLPTITLDEVANSAPSSLAAFKSSQRNPFTPLKDLPKIDKPEGENETVTRGGDDDGATAGKASGAGSGAKPASDAKAGGGSAGSGGGGAGSYVGPRTTYFTYRADVRFGEPGKEKTIKQLESFSLLGDEENPAAMFLGISDDHEYAVFVVDAARYEANGEHECKPSEDRCEFIYLKVDGDANETTFTTLDGSKTYNLEILAIKRIVLDKSDVEDVPTEDKKSGKSDADDLKKVDDGPLSLFDIIAKRR